MTTPDDRLTMLEMQCAQQERTIEELSGQLAEQWRVIETMRRTIEMLKERFSALEDHAGQDTPITKPPHW